MCLQLCGNARLVLTTIAESPDNHLSIPRLSNDTGLSESTVRRYVRVLIVLKLINARRFATGRGYTYTFDVHPAAWQALHSTDHDLPRLA